MIKKNIISDKIFEKYNPPSIIVKLNPSDKKIKENEIIVGQGHEHPLLLKDGLTANDFHWILDKEPKTNWVYAAKTRYRQNDAPCEIDEINDKEFNMMFGQKQWAITPGQSVVIYESNVCLGGGISKESINDE